MKIRTNYTCNSNSFSLFSYLSKVLECCKRARWDFTAQMVRWYCAFCAPLEGALVENNALFWQQCFFTYNVQQEWASLFNGRVICRKPKIPASRKTSLQCQHKYGKECKFNIKWCTVIVNIKFLFDFLVPENLDSTLLKLCELILASVYFSGLHDGLILRTSLRRKNIHRNMLCSVV